MFRKNHLLLALALSFSASAHALTGGPFDNGDYSQLLDEAGVYQWTAYFSNGIGQGQFNPHTSYGPSISSTGSSGTSQATTNAAIGTIAERSIFYYKGITFFGGCFGNVDTARKKITCITNGQSEVNLSQQATTSTTTTIIGTASNVNATTTVVNNGSLGFVANSEWSAGIGPMEPNLEFSGEGELTVLTPSVQPLLSNLAQQIITASSGNVTNVASSLAVLSTSSFLANVTPQNLAEVDAAAEHIHIIVSGTRKFFL